MMKTFKYMWIVMAAVAGMAGCGKDAPAVSRSGSNAQIGLAVSVHNADTRAIDADNLAEEQAVYDLSVFFTAPGGDAITHKYVHTGFTRAGDHYRVSVPLEANDLGVRDIYMVANHGDAATLAGVQTVTDLQRLRTPFVDGTNNLEVQNGFCMYGMLRGFDFTDSGAGTALVPVERTCAKYRVSISFPENPDQSTDNALLVGNAPNYTYLAEDAGPELPSTAYFDFTGRIPLVSDGAGNYTGNAYVYESSEEPMMYLYTHIGGSEQELSAKLPIPDRNYLYDIVVEIYRTTRSSGAEYGVKVLVRDIAQMN